MPGTFAYTKSTNTVVVTGGTSGSPADFASFVTADRAGSVTLKAATTSAFNMTLTYQITPVEKRALTISFVLAGTSSGTTQNWFPASVNVTAGSISSGSVASVAADDGTKLVVDEAVATPGFDFDFTWSGLPTNYYAEKVLLNGYYAGNPAHDVWIYMWNYNTSGWVRLTAAAQDFPSAAADADYVFDVPSTNRSYYFNAGAAKIQIYHNSSGSAGHQFFVDLLKLYRPAINNTLEVTGTDFDDVAQTDSINVSAGNATYTGAKKWRTITDIDCNGWADGTLAVTQPQWGVIWDIGNNYYQVDAKFMFGDESTATYFTALSVSVTFTYDTEYVTYITANATVVFGQLDNDTAGSTSLGCNIVVNVPTNNRALFRSTSTVSAYLQLYSTSVSYIGSSNNFCVLQPYRSKYINCLFYNMIVTDRAGYTSSVFKNLIASGSKGYIQSIAGTIENIIMSGTSYGFVNTTSISSTLRNLSVRNVVNQHLRGFGITADSYIIDLYTYGETITASFGGTCTHKFYLQYSVTIHVADKSGVNLSGVTIVCLDKDASQQFSQVTAVDGTISTQTVTRGYYDQAGGTVLYDSTPHSFILSKTGYETLTLENITIDSPIDWHLELQNPCVDHGTSLFDIETDELVYVADDSACITLS